MSKNFLISAFRIWWAEIICTGLSKKIHSDAAGCEIHWRKLRGTTSRSSIFVEQIFVVLLTANAEEREMSALVSFGTFTRFCVLPRSADHCFSIRIFQWGFHH